MPHEPAILIVNPGSTSTKLAVFTGGELTESVTFPHSAGDLSRFPRVWDQFEFRLNLCREWASPRLDRCDAVVAIGGLLRPVEGGVYRINDRMILDARSNLQGEHASNLGCAIAHRIAAEFRCPSFTVDPVSTDEFEPLAYYSGHPCIPRKSLSHALSIHACARRAARELGIRLKESSFVVGHLGGGISVAPVKSGRIVDANDAASDGPFSPERTGGLPLQAFISHCLAAKGGEADLRSFVMGKGGLAAYLGTNSVREAEERIHGGDRTAREVLEAMAYQIAKEIGAMATVLRGTLDAVVLTGSVAGSGLLVSWIGERVRFLGPLLVYPGDAEMVSLAEGAARALCNEEAVKEY
jgi:butyrate kinase